MSDTNPWVNDIHEGDCLELLREMPESSVHSVVTSPPYHGLRDYGEDVESIVGGDEDCDHEWATRTKAPQGGENTDENPPDVGANASTQETRLRGGDGVDSNKCVHCGAWKGQLGLESQLHQFVENLVAVGEAIRHVLREDGSWWLNLGDSFAGSGRGQWDDDEGRPKESYKPDAGSLPDRQETLPRKSKMLVPHRVAIALQDAGWIVRSDAVWTKANAMPHPVKDRLNETKEFIFHLVPNPDYYFDMDAIREPHAEQSLERSQYEYTSAGNGASEMPGESRGDVSVSSGQDLHPNGKNPGDIFDVPVKSFPDAHFAVYPPELIEKPIKATVPERVCADCGAPYERTHEETYLWERNRDSITRPQSKRALEIYDHSDLTVSHLKAARAVGFGDGDHGDASQGSRDRVGAEQRRLADEAKDVLGGYFREFVASRSGDATGFTQSCDCDTDETEPGIVLDPFAGAGTTCLVAKRLGRRFIGTELNPDYVAMAQKRVGIDVDEPDRLLEDGETSLTAFTDGGDSE